MFGKLRGIIDEIGEDWILLDGNGIGWTVFLTQKNLATLGVGSNLTVYTEVVFRQDHVQILGFLQSFERQWFRILLSVPGIGPRIALQILDTVSIPDLAQSILNQDPTLLKQVNGVGVKAANRLLLELKGNKKIALMAIPIEKSFSEQTGVQQDALSALVNLGFEKSSILKILQDLTATHPLVSLEELIRLALSRLSISSSNH
jgi:Holliday junction DNA helicase RuvA